jgi:hypothetical protein
MKELVIELLDIFDAREEDGRGNPFSPTRITTCRVQDMDNINRILKALREGVCNHDYEGAIRTKPFTYECPLCGADVSLAVLMIEGSSIDSQKEEPSPQRHENGHIHLTQTDMKPIREETK